MGSTQFLKGIRWISLILYQTKFKGLCCESDMPLFKWNHLTVYLPIAWTVPRLLEMRRVWCWPRTRESTSLATKESDLTKIHILCFYGIWSFKKEKSSVQTKFLIPQPDQIFKNQVFFFLKTCSYPPYENLFPPQMLELFDINWQAYVLICLLLTHKIINSFFLNHLVGMKKRSPVSKPIWL